MAATDQERLSSLEADSRRHSIEIDRLRKKSHRMSNTLAAYDVEDFDQRIRKLEASYNRATGIAITLGALAGAAGGLLAKLV